MSYSPKDYIVDQTKILEIGYIANHLNFESFIEYISEAQVAPDRDETYRQSAAALYDCAIKLREFQKSFSEMRKIAIGNLSKGKETDAQKG